MHDVQLAFAHSTQTVFYIMAAVMAVVFVISLRYLPRGRIEAVGEAEQAAAAVVAAAGDPVRR